MNLHNDSAIVFQNVSKVYRLYQNQWQMVRDALGFKSKNQFQEFHALKNISLTINRGDRIGLIGRNGAGKSTLLKLITGNFAQTSGNIIVNGQVQALMNTGIGFHPEFTGLENIKASLLYNGLKKNQFNDAVEDVIDFVELGDFLDQPLKTYSLGMQSRLHFAVATSIKPEILIVDEVLGAGDAYFSAKSADRMKKLTGSGCTLILVSHSTQQILQFCDQAVWIECGEILQRGETIEVVKDYEQYTKKLEMEFTSKNIALPLEKKSVIQSKWLRERLLNEVLSQHHGSQNADGENKLNNQMVGLSQSLSRWPSHDKRLKIYLIELLSESGNQINTIKSGEPLQINMTVQAKETGSYNVYFVILLFTEDGRWLTRHCSEKFHIELAAEEKYTIQMRYDEVLLGAGKYIFSAAIYKVLDLDDLSTAQYYDLLSRSFNFEVKGFSKEDTTLFRHPVRWLLNDFNLDDQVKIKKIETVEI